jgi:integrase
MVAKDGRQCVDGLERRAEDSRGMGRVIERVPRSIKLLRAPTSVATFHDFSDFEKLVEAAKDDGAAGQLIVLLGGEAGLRCGEIMALEWRDLDSHATRGCDRVVEQDRSG